MRTADPEFLDALVALTGRPYDQVIPHLIKLEEAEYIGIEKTFRGKIPLTLVRLTAKGREAFQGYRKTMNGLLR